LSFYLLELTWYQLKIRNEEFKIFAKIGQMGYCGKGIFWLPAFAP
jgi:hypothetical protein